MSLPCLLFGGFVVGVTALWVYLLRDKGFAFLAYAMFFPGAAALLWTLLKGSILEFIYEICGVTQVCTPMYRSK